MVEIPHFSLGNAPKNLEIRSLSDSCNWIVSETKTTKKGHGFGFSWPCDAIACTV